MSLKLIELNAMSWGSWLEWGNFNLDLTHVHLSLSLSFWQTFRIEYNHPLSISWVHIDYNYLQVITTHTSILYHRALTAVQPPYSAKLVFPFQGKKWKDKKTNVKLKKMKRSMMVKRSKTRSGVSVTCLGYQASSSFPFPLFTFNFTNSSLHSWRVYFCNLPWQHKANN